VDMVLPCLCCRMDDVLQQWASRWKLFAGGGCNMDIVFSGGLHDGYGEQQWAVGWTLFCRSRLLDGCCLQQGLQDISIVATVGCRMDIVCISGLHDIYCL
jgi:hypothetical protein